MITSINSGMYAELNLYVGDLGQATPSISPGLIYKFEIILALTESLSTQHLSEKTCRSYSDFMVRVGSAHTSLCCILGMTVQAWAITDHFWEAMGFPITPTVARTHSLSPFPSLALLFTWVHSPSLFLLLPLSHPLSPHFSFFLWPTLLRTIQT